MKIILTSLLVFSTAALGAAPSGPVPGSLPATVAPAVNSIDRFDDSVRDDFFDGMLHGDQVAFDRGMKSCADTLAKKPLYAPALSWQGCGFLYQSGHAFQAGDIQKGMDLWQRGLKEMNAAVDLQPENLQVIIPRGATFLGIAKYDPDRAEGRGLLKTGVADFEKTLQREQAIFATLSVHSRGELLSGLASGYLQLGEREKALPYLNQIIRDLPESAYATRASELLLIADPAALKHKARAMSCIGCHTD
jgi:tetratricopeptide (TPR) repeat protein